MRILYENFIMRFDGMQWQQPLDYEGVPFRCRKCHEVGHLYKDCPRKGAGRMIVKKSCSRGTQTVSDSRILPDSAGLQTRAPELSGDGGSRTATVPTWTSTQPRSRPQVSSVPPSRISSFRVSEQSG